LATALVFLVDVDPGVVLPAGFIPIVCQAASE
jgi:hypothetical protein